MCVVFVIVLLTATVNPSLRRRSVMLFGPLETLLMTPILKTSFRSIPLILICIILALGMMTVLCSIYCLNLAKSLLAKI